MNLLHAFGRAIPPLRRLHDSRNELAARLAAAEAGWRRSACKVSPFSFYNTVIDAEGVMRRHAVPSPEARPGYLVNFLGVAIDPKFFPSILDGKAGQVEGVPIPANWHADIAEWGAALRAVDLAKQVGNRFTMMELGCGWGCWMNNTGVAARRAGLGVRLIGIEGDPGHIEFAREACATNGFSPAQVELHHGVAGAKPGVALFPRQDEAGVTWGLEPLFDPTPQALEDARASGRYDELPVIGLDALAKGHQRIDLLHVDIQGGEADLIEQSLDFLKSKVAYILVGTHAREIEGRLFHALGDAGWRLEIERPAILALSDKGPVVTVDGVQGWRNPSLSPQ